MGKGEDTRAILQQGSASRWLSPISRRALALLVHIDALRADPAIYFKAVWQRMLGKRLRARLMMAPLLGSSPRAYRLWQLRKSASDLEETNLLSDKVPDPSKIRLFAAVLKGEDLEESLASLAREKVNAFVVKDIGEIEAASLAGNTIGPNDWIMTIPSGDTLTVGAGETYRRAAGVAEPHVQIIYADDDLSADGKPHFKPGWNKELFEHLDYLSGAAIVRLSAFRTPGSGAPADVVRTIGDSAGSILHVAKVLHHRRSRPEPRRPVPFTLSSEQRASLLPLTVIVPTRNRVDLLHSCLKGLQQTDYPARLEILVVDNGSDDPETLRYLEELDREFARVIKMPGDFNFAAINNAAVAEASGELLCFLNNDVETITADWLEALACQALRPDVGAVGAQLLYPCGRIQHAGVVLGIGGGAAHAHRLLKPGEEGYFHRHALPQFVSAVTAACMVVKRERFLAVDGFDAQNFAVSFNDVDLCLKLNARGWQTLYEPRALLVHHESKSRGLDRDVAGATRLAGELAALQRRWGIAPARTPGKAHLRVSDPYHHPALSPFSERFVVEV